MRKYKALIQICLEYFLTHLDFILSWEPVSLSVWTSSVGLAYNKAFIATHPLGGDLSLLPPRPASPYSPGAGP